MSVYKLLNLPTNSTYIDVLRRCKHCIDDLDASDHVFKDEMKEYIMRVCAVLLHPSGRQCLTFIDESFKTYISASKSKLLLKLVSSFETDIGKKVFHESLLQPLTNSSQKTLHFNRFKTGFKKFKKQFKCRWCSTCIQDKKAIYTLICKCSFRSGHEFCGKEFHRVHNRCPICRQKLLKRKGVSKYMLFNTDKMYEIR